MLTFTEIKISEALLCYGLRVVLRVLHKDSHFVKNSYLSKGVQVQFGLAEIEQGCKFIMIIYTRLPANLEITKKYENQILSQTVREKSLNFQFLTKSQRKRGKFREKLFVAMVTFYNAFSLYVSIAIAVRY